MNRINESAGVWALGAVLVLAPLACLPGIYRCAHFPKLLVLQAGAFALALCCAAARNLWLPRRSPFTLPLALYLAATALQALRSVNPAGGTLMLATQAGFGALCLGAACVVAPGREVSLARFSAAAGLAVGLIGILEHFGLPWAMLPSAGRPSATFGFRNIAAMYLAVNLPVSALLLFRRERRDWALGLAAAGAMAAFLLATRSRGAWLGLAAAGGAGAAVAHWCRAAGEPALSALLRRRLTPRRWVITAAVLAAALWLGARPARYVDRSLHRLDEKKAGVVTTVASLAGRKADRGRLRVWRHTLEMVAARPLAGVGLENWAVFFPKYDRGDATGLETAAQRPHNDYLWIWAELGAAGLLAYLWLLWSAGRQVAEKVRAGDAEERMLALFLGMGVLALLVHAFFSFPRQQAGPSAVFWIALGLAARPKPDRARPVGPFARACIGLGAAAALAGAWLFAEAIRFDRHFLRALAAQQAGEYGAQYRAAAQARASGLFDHRVFLLMGDARFRQGDHSGAVEVYRTYRIYQPYLPAVYNNLGQALEGTGAFDEAADAYSRGLEIFPGEQTLQNNLAASYKRQGDEDRALEIYEAEGGKSAEAYHNLGLIYAERRAFSQALEAYREALRIDPGMVAVHYSMAGLYLLMDDFERSAERFELFLQKAPANPALVRRAKARLLQLYPVLGDRAIRAGDMAGAERAYERLAELGGERAEVYNNLANLYRRRGDREAALAACRKAVEMDPESAQARFTLAMLLDEAGERDGAVAAYRAFLSRWEKADRLAARARERIAALSGTK